ncbi:TetR/AcrR family transcriptional regulator [Actinomadura vinacea]|uniref:TetR/AcrR family transcriptional regulator n=1 Tax=Actinomadura vinacea TaxID=115336 RepID=A0ABN3ITL5_9ACTN
MARWEADPRGRLERAALELFTERGYDQTTVAQITERAGLTERSFYRHYADKREVLFGGGEELEKHLVAAVGDAGAGLAPLDALITALQAAEAVFRPRDAARKRRDAIAANPALYERELIKLASLSAALADTLARRGVDARTAQLATDMAMSVFRLAFERWIAEDDAHFAALVRESAHELRQVANTTGSGPSSSPTR